MSDKRREFFDELVAKELASAREQHPPINSLHKGFAVIMEEFDEFKAEVWKRSSARQPHEVLRELVQLAAMCQRVAEDVLYGKVHPRRTG